MYISEKILEAVEQYLDEHPYPQPTSTQNDAMIYHLVKMIYSVKGKDKGNKQVTTTHYQPLLEAKDAEINRMAAVIGEMQPVEAMITLREENTTLKALLDKAREVLNKGGEFIEIVRNADPAVEDFKKYAETTESIDAAIAAINAATGEK